MGILKKHPAIFLGLGITILFLLLSYSKIDFFDALELKFYDIRMNLRNIPEDSDEIVIVDIDNDSIDKLGRWPWSRSLIAECIQKISIAEPKIIGLNIIYSEPEESSGLQQIKNLIQMVEESGSKNPSLIRNMKQVMEQMDNDRKLKDTFNSTQNVILPVFFKESRLGGAKQTETSLEFINKVIAEQNVSNPASNLVPVAADINMPIYEFLKASQGIGHVNLAFDLDGKIRRNSLLYKYGELYVPSFPLILAATYLNVPNTQIRANIGKSIDLADSVQVPVTAGSQLLVSFKGSAKTFKTFSFYDVIKDKIPQDVFKSVFKEKIVLITPSAAGIMNPLSTPVAQQMDVGEFTANAVWTIIHKQFIVKPAWDNSAGLIMIAVVGILISLILPRLKAILSGLAFISSLGLLLGGSIYIFISQGTWIQITCPLLQLIFGYIGVVTINFFVTETGKEKVEGESAETNRMLGLSFQSQGMLDMAFDKFRKVAVDDETKDLLYNLALDYERKRQYNKAASVYEYIEQHDENYKDVGKKKLKLLHASETMVFGADSLLGGSTSGGDPLLSGAGDTKPTLGRYEIIKQLGKGAMGIVYLGQDPRINRTTAIKTFKFTEDFEPEEAEKLKQKFFREAESAGTLSHPNIVTIYDAGDEHDLAYIAMEFLDGEDFHKYTKKNQLLPMRKVIDYVADIADALDYAHEKGIVHRDIKPANIMILKSGIVKITDFGIARITATSQTQTGVVKGTPHYMSPEQISGKKVDGRSDIFSLGAMLFQLLTGELPFRGDSPAALMHQIMNVHHPDPRKINPKIVKPLVTIIDKSLDKDRNKRYPRANHMAKHLRTLGAKIDAVIAQKKQGATQQ